MKGAQEVTSVGEETRRCEGRDFRKGDTICKATKGLHPGLWIAVRKGSQATMLHEESEVRCVWGEFSEYIKIEDFEYLQI